MGHPTPRWRGTREPRGTCWLSDVQYISMPELPEVETVVRGLRRHLPGRRIVELRLGKTDFIDDPVAIGERVPGSLIRGVRRHGKFLVLELERGGEARVEELLVVHLGMTGQLIVVAADAEIAPHTHAFFTLDDRRELRFRDPRRFGRMLVAAPADGEKILGPLGADPLEVSEADFRRLISSRRARIKALLLDQHVFRGMGNIYTDESLWKAKIHPARLGREFKGERDCALATSDARDFGRGDSAGRIFDLGLCGSGWRAGGVSDSASGLRPRGEEVFSVRSKDSTNHRCWTQQLFLSKVPEGAAWAPKLADGRVAQPLLAVPAVSSHVMESIASYKPAQAGVPVLLHRSHL